MKRLLLAGAGHAHAQVLRRWISDPVPGVELVLVSPQALSPYSGMVPAWLAGDVRYDEICIDVQALAAASGARWVQDELVGVAADARQVQLASGGTLDYSLLSLNVGSTLQPPAGLPSRLPSRLHMRTLALRPLGALRSAWEASLPELAAEPQHRPCHITAVGGGAAGVESLLAILARLRRQQPQRRFTASLVTQSADILRGLARGAVRAARDALARASVDVRTGIRFTPDVAARTDLLLWATGALPHAWQASSGLALDAAGFVSVDAQLRSVSHPEVFAVGDGAGFTPNAAGLPKAGVHAVRMGPVLADNLRATLTGNQTLRSYVPQRQFLVLLSTADGRAIAARGGFWAAGPLLGRCAWHWKQRIDRGFVAGFSVQPALPYRR